MIESDPAFRQRQQRLLDELNRLELDVLLLNAGPSLAYLAGLHVHLSERPALAVFQLDGPPLFVLPELEAGKLDSLPFEARTVTYGEDPATWPSAVGLAAREARLDYRRVGVEPSQFRVLELRLVEEAAPRAAYLDGSSAVTALRARKDASEVRRMKQAVLTAERALEVTLTSVEAGITERELASTLTARLLVGGSASALPFSPIVAFGSRTADPHAVPSDRALEDGDLVLVDWGANVDGYMSDLTRMFRYGKLDERLHEIVEIVGEANEAARRAAGPGVPVAAVDRAARSIIEEAGFGEAFVHRTGHGLGLEVHEPPFIRSGSSALLETGMTFTIEPGIYLPGQGGARIEDDVVVTDDGVEVLSTQNRELIDLKEAGIR